MYIYVKIVFDIICNIYYVYMILYVMYSYEEHAYNVFINIYIYICINTHVQVCTHVLRWDAS